MINGIEASNGIFLADLNLIQNRISQENQQITSGVRVGQASDDPAAVVPILQYQNEIDRLTQVQTNHLPASTGATRSARAGRVALPRAPAVPASPDATRGTRAGRVALPARTGLARITRCDARYPCW
jgi:hypothetical protein